jgi:effector-binding domain-containing protein
MRGQGQRGDDWSMSHQITVKDVPGGPTLSIRAEVSPAGIGRAIASAIGELTAYLSDLGVEPEGAPFVVYHRIDDAGLELEVCMPVAETCDGHGRIVSREIEAATVAWTIHPGPYASEGQAYADLAIWMGEHGYRPVGPPRETYLIGPAETSDESAYRTEIDWPVR